MANHDVYNDPAPQNVLRPIKSPKVSSLKTALAAHSATSYSAERLNDMTRNDMVYAAKVHNLAVVNPALVVIEA